MRGDSGPTPCEGDPSGVSGGLAAPAWHHQQTAGDSEGDDAQDDEEERGDPLWGQLRGDAGPVPAVDGLALPDQTHSQRAWMEPEGDESQLCESTSFSNCRENPAQINNISPPCVTSEADTQTYW